MLTSTSSVTPPDPSPNTPFLMTNILIVGAGGIGERHLRCFQKIGVGRVGIVESHPERRALIASRYQCPSYAT